jgi:hypothetical protein
MLKAVYTYFRFLCSFKKADRNSTYVVASFRKADSSSHAALENLFGVPKLLYKFYFHQTTFEESPFSPRPIRN